MTAVDNNNNNINGNNDSDNKFSQLAETTHPSNDGCYESLFRK